MSAKYHNIRSFQPNWQSKFRELPQMPSSKRWTNGLNFTAEQNIIFKLLSKKPISEDEKTILKELDKYYIELDLKLRTLDYKTFNETDLYNFRNYIFYAFNFDGLITNQLKIDQTYRVVINENIIKSNERIYSSHYLTYPSIDIVRKSGRFNRANTSNTTVFYTSETIDTALKELKPPVGKIITIGAWKPKSQTKTFTSFPVGHNERAFMNEGARKATSAFNDIASVNPPELIQYVKRYFELIGREFSKKVEHHYEYIISALFSESILACRDDPRNEFNMECIVYPSVGNEFNTSNVAFHPSVAEEHLYLDHVIELLVEETYYDRPYVRHATTSAISLIKATGYGTDKIDPDGTIHW